MVIECGGILLKDRGFTLDFLTKKPNGKAIGSFKFP